MKKQASNGAKGINGKVLKNRVVIPPNNAGITLRDVNQPIEEVIDALRDNESNDQKDGESRERKDFKGIKIEMEYERNDKHE